MARRWEPDPQASFERRLGKSAGELDKSNKRNECPDIWRLSSGDVAVIGRDLTADYRDRLPADVHLAADERLVVIPGDMLIAAKEDIPDG